MIRAVTDLRTGLTAKLLLSMSPPERPYQVWEMRHPSGITYYFTGSRTSGWEVMNSLGLNYWDAETLAQAMNSVQM